MHCPDCNTEYQCPCIHCMSNNTGLEPWKFLDNGDQYCTGCGVVRNADEWMDIEWSQYKSKMNIVTVEDENGN